jgi:hypothetical protein
MALLISHPTQFGVNAEYWRIASIEEHFFRKELKVTLVGYANKATAKLPGTAPLASAELNVGSEDYVLNCSRQQAYGIVKKQSQFLMAKDDLDAPNPPPVSPPIYYPDPQVAPDNTKG